MKVSTTKVKCYKACRKKYFFEYIEGLKPVVKAQPLADGTTYHETLERLYKGEITAQSITYDGTMPANITAMCVAYAKYIYPQFKCEQSEVPFSLRLTPTIELVGRFDGVAEDGCVVEHKTTSSEVNDEYLYGLQWDEQVLNYMLASGKNKIYYTVCRKPTIRQKMSETDEEFFERCCEWYDTDTALKIRVVEVTRFDDEIAQQRKALISIAREMSNNERKEDKELVFYRNPSHCTQYGRRCEFASICLDYKPNITYIEFERRK